MGDLCEEAINNVVSALVEDEETRLKKVFKIETKIDAQEQNIESLCMKLLLQQQPVARDLRTISSALNELNKRLQNIEKMLGL
jgi:phosphate transport system protein